MILTGLDPWIFSALNAIPALTGKIVYFYPESFSALPVLAYRCETRTSKMNYADNVNYAVDSTIELDLYNKSGIDDSSILSSIDSALVAKGFALQSIVPLADPDNRLTHAHLSYSRAGLTNEDLI